MTESKLKISIQLFHVHSFKNVLTNITEVVIATKSFLKVQKLSNHMVEILHLIKNKDNHLLIAAVYAFYS